MKRITIQLLGVLLGLPIFGHAQTTSPDNRELLQRLVQGDRKVIPAIVKQGDALVPDLTKLLKEGPRSERALVASVLADIASRDGSQGKTAIPALCELLNAKDRSAANEAARALGAIGPDAVPAVVKTLKAVENQPDALFAARVLVRIGPGAKAAAPAVLSVLKANGDPQIRLACIQVLDAVKSVDGATVEELLKIAAADPKAAYYQVHLIVALGKVGPNAKAAIPFLAKTMKDAPEPHFRIHALESLARIDPASPQLTEGLVRMLDSPDMPKLMVLESLSKGGTLTKEGLKAIEERLRDRDSAIRLQAAVVFGKTNADHPAVVSILIESLQERDPRMRRQAAEAIGQLRPRDEAVLEALTQRARDADPEVRKAVAVAIGIYQKK